jgi:HK97 family phage major capsid protein
MEPYAKPNTVTFTHKSALAAYVSTLALTNGDMESAGSLAEKRYRDRPSVSWSQKAQVGAASLANTSALQQSGIAREFIESIRPFSVLAKLQPLMRKAPFNVQTPRELTVPNAAWIPELGATPAAAHSYDSVTLPNYKCGLQVILSKELMQYSSPAAESVIKNALGQSLAQFLDAQFLTPTVGISTFDHPAAVTNAASTVVSTGSTAALIQADLSSMVALLTSWNEPRWVMRPSTAAALSAKFNVAGSLQFPGIAAKGGTLMGIEVVTSTNSPSQITLVDVNDVIIADEGEIEIAVAGEASVLMDDAPNASPTTSALVSLWERNLVSIKAIRYISWLRAHATGGVVYMTVSY